MSFLRIRSPHHPPRDIWLGPNHARVSARMGIRGGGGNPIVVGAHRAKFVDDRVMKNPDNGGVQAPITEVHP